MRMIIAVLALCLMIPVAHADDDGKVCIQVDGGPVECN